MKRTGKSHVWSIRININTHNIVLFETERPHKVIWILWIISILILMNTFFFILVPYSKFQRKRKAFVKWLGPLSCVVNPLNAERKGRRKAGWLTSHGSPLSNSLRYIRTEHRSSWSLTAILSLLFALFSKAHEIHRTLSNVTGLSRQFFYTP